MASSFDTPAWHLHNLEDMRGRLHSKLTAMLVAPALVVASATQGRVLMLCGPTVSMSCCCVKDVPASSATVGLEARQCCDTLAIPTTPVQSAHERAVTTLSAPILAVVVLRPAILAEISHRIQNVRRLDPPSPLTPVLANCALLI